MEKIKLKRDFLQSAQWHGDPEKFEDFINNLSFFHGLVVPGGGRNIRVSHPDRIGAGVAKPGDYIIKDGHGYLYVCPEALYHQTYEPQGE